MIARVAEKALIQYQGYTMGFLLFLAFGGMVVLQMVQGSELFEAIGGQLVFFGYWVLICLVTALAAVVSIAVIMAIKLVAHVLILGLKVYIAENPECRLARANRGRKAFAQAYKEN